MRSRLPLTCAALAAAITAAAGWEDAPATPAPAPTPAARPVAPAARPVPPPPAAAPRRASGSGIARPQPVVFDDFYVPYFDAVRVSDRWFGLSYLFGSDAGAAGGTVSTMELEGHFLVGDYRNVAGGDIRLNIDPMLMLFTDDGGLNNLPTLLLDIPFDVQWVWRFVNGFSLELGAAPGIYGDIEAFDFSVFNAPLRGCLYLSVLPELAFRVGAEARFGWDRVVMPLAGLSWEPADNFYLEVGVPRSLAVLRTGPADFYGKVEWENTTYALSGDDDKPEDLTIDDWRVGGGISFGVGDDVRLSFELGLVLDREFRTDGDSGGARLDLDDSVYFGIFIGSRF